MALFLIPNLQKREFTTAQRNKACVTEITHIRTWQDGTCRPQRA